MRTGVGMHRRLWVVLALILGLGMALSPAARADTKDLIADQHDPPQPGIENGWQAGTCYTDTPECTVDTPEQFYEEAAGHPPKGFTQFIIRSEPPGETPVGDLRTVRVDLPPGLTVNPQATPQCDLGPYGAEGEPERSPATCTPDTQVGISTLTVVPVELLDVPLGNPVTLPPVPVYNIVPKQGEPARFGFSIAGSDVFLEAGVTWQSDYHEFFTIHAHKIEPELGPAGPTKVRVLKNRLTFDGIKGDGTFITTPSTCFGQSVKGSPFEHQYTTWLRADSFQDPDPIFPNGSTPLAGKIPPGTSPKNCETIPFEPSITVDPATPQTDSPSGAAVTVNLPWIENPIAQQTSPVRHANVSLPQGMGLNPSAANGLQACTDAQFGKGTTNAVACPPASRVGAVEIETPPLEPGSVRGDVYVGQPIGRDPTSGLYRIFVHAKSDRYGISARLIGNVAADPQTGKLTTTFADGPLGIVPLPGLPQVPFSSFRLDFNDGPNAPLSSPQTCGPNPTNTQMTPWSSAVGPVPPGGEEGPSTDPPATPGHQFALAAQPGGGPCATTMAGRPFAPSFAARSDRPRAGTFSPFQVRLTRADGNQELKVVDVLLPPGHTAKLAGLKYCPQSAIAAAAANSGAAEAANASCPASSFIGTAVVKSGTGPDPLQIQGKAFLSGPYNGAPLSLVFVTPATAGPFDLGSVVVRVALFVEPETAQVHAVSDPIPHVFGGALLGIRSIVVRTERKDFSLNPTNCSKLPARATLRGGGANPLHPAAFSAFAVSDLLKANGCKRLRFKPKLNMRIFGGTQRAKNPKLRAIVRARKGHANIGRAAVALPKYFFLDQASLAKVCTRVQFAANDCPRNSIYGHARAITPLLDKPVKGPVYLRSSNNPLPDLVAKLRGQVEVHLVGRTDSRKGRIRNTFDVVPDVPVKKFMLTIRGGKKGLLVNSTNICKLGRKQLKVIANFKGQNGKKRKLRPKLRTPCDKKKARGGKKN